jgi:hypothetical protein
MQLSRNLHTGASPAQVAEALQMASEWAPK